MNALVAMLFLFNLLAIMPMFMQHSQQTTGTHTVSSELGNLSDTQNDNQHRFVEHCSMASCSFALSDFHPITKIAFAEKTAFSISATELESLYRAPPKRPPSA